MRFGLIPEGLIDWIGMATGFPPPAMTETYAPLYARAIVAATELGVFDAIGGERLSANEVASACGTDPR
ncbi:MAG TPA: hypothetical protein VJ839_04950, partial [Candidatus Limnocylindria bacterium]|nr:hypothetical protein [Candidatus Limnocylindria bacterium]